MHIHTQICFSFNQISFYGYINSCLKMKWSYRESLSIIKCIIPFLRMCYKHINSFATYDINSLIYVYSLMFPFQPLGTYDSRCEAHEMSLNKSHNMTQSYLVILTTNKIRMIIKFYILSFIKEKWLNLCFTTLL